MLITPETRDAYTANIKQSVQAMWQAKQDGATDAEIITIAVDYQKRGQAIWMGGE